MLLQDLVWGGLAVSPPKPPFEMYQKLLYLYHEDKLQILIILIVLKPFFYSAYSCSSHI
jgi:hypothetical protein